MKEIVIKSVDHKKVEREILAMFGLTAGNVISCTVRLTTDDLPIAEVELYAVESEESFDLDSLVQTTLARLKSEISRKATQQKLSIAEDFAAVRVESYDRLKPDLHRAWLNRLRYFNESLWAGNDPAIK